MDENAADPYKVGYGKPPKSGQFKAGKSGNRKGRPKKSKNIRTLVNEVLGERVVITEAGKPKKMQKAEALVRKTFAQAMKGDAKARNDLFDLHEPDDGKEADQGTLSAIELADVKEFASRMTSPDPEQDYEMPKDSADDETD